MPKRPGARRPLNGVSQSCSSGYSRPFNPNEHSTANSSTATYSHRTAHTGGTSASAASSTAIMPGNSRVSELLHSPVHRAQHRVFGRHRQIARRRGAVEHDFTRGTMTQRLRVLAIRVAVRHGDEHQQHAAHREAGDHRPREARPPQEQRHHARDRQRRHQEQRVVDARQQLADQEHAGEHAVARAALAERAMERPQRERNPHRPLQFQVHDVIGAVRRERIDHRREKRRHGVTRQPPRQQIHARAGSDDAGEEHQVHHQQRLHAGLDERRGDHPLQQHRVRIGQRARLGIEDIGVEQIDRIVEQLMRHPRQPPHAERRIDVPDDQRRQPLRHRPGEEHRQGAEEQGDEDAAQPRAAGRGDRGRRQTDRRTDPGPESAGEQRWHQLRCGRQRPRPASIGAAYGHAQGAPHRKWPPARVPFSHNGRIFTVELRAGWPIVSVSTVSVVGVGCQCCLFSRRYDSPRATSSS